MHSKMVFCLNLNNVITTDPTDFSILRKLHIGHGMVLGFLILYLILGMVLGYFLLFLIHLTIAPLDDLVQLLWTL